MNRRVWAVVCVAAVAAPVLVAGSQAPAAAVTPGGPGVTAQQAADALAAATTVDAAKAAILDILTGAGVAVDDGTGAPAASAVAVIPDWEVDALGVAHVAGQSVTVAENAQAFDVPLRWSGQPGVSADQWSAALAGWVSAPDDPREQYALDALEEFGKQTDPPYDLAAGAPADAPLPVWALLFEEIALADPGAAAPSGWQAVPTAARVPADAGISPCEVADQVHTWTERASKVAGFLEAFDWESADRALRSIIDYANDQLDAAQSASQAAEGELLGGAEGAATIAIVNGLLSMALSQGYLDVQLTQDPHPVTKHEQGAQPNTTKLEVVVKAKDDMPKKLADCLGLISPVKIDLPGAGEAIDKANVTVTPGAHFDEHLTAGAITPQDHHAGKDGIVTYSYDTKPQKLPPGKGTEKQRDAVVHVEVAIRDLGLGPDKILAAIFDKVAPWSDDFDLAVEQREDPSLSVKADFDAHSFIGGTVSGSVDLHSCDGWNGYFTGQFSTHAADVTIWKTFADAMGLADSQDDGGPLNLHFPVTFPTGAQGTDNQAVPVPGSVVDMGSFLTLKVIDESTLELGIKGTTILDFSTFQRITFTVTHGADECTGQ